MFEVSRDQSRQRALARLRKLRRPLPPGFVDRVDTRMPDKAFFDTNILINAIAWGDPRAPRAEELLATGGVLSVQVLNEFVSVVRRKIRMPWKEVREALEAIRILCPSPAPSRLTHTKQH